MLMAISRRLTLQDHSFPRHAHAGWSIAVVERGTGFFRCAGVDYRAPAGAITVLHPGEAHDGRVCAREGLGYCVLVLPQQAIAWVFGNAGTSCFPDRVINDRDLAVRLVALHRMLSAPTGTREDLEVDSAAVAVLGRLFQRHAGAMRADTVPSRVVQVARRYLDERITVGVSLGELAEVAGVHPATLLRRFRLEVGLAPYEYLVARRVDLARQLLSAGRPIAEVATHSGFADQSHLHRHFKRIVGVTPGRFVRV